MRSALGLLGLAALVLVWRMAAMPPSDTDEESKLIRIVLLPLWSDEFPRPTDQVLLSTRDRVTRGALQRLRWKVEMTILEEKNLEWFFGDDLNEVFRGLPTTCTGNVVDRRARNDPLRHVEERIGVKVEHGILDFDELRRFFDPNPTSLKELSTLVTDKYLTVLNSAKKRAGGKLPAFVQVECWRRVLQLLPIEADVVLVNVPLTTLEPDVFHPDYFTLGSFAHYSKLVSAYPFVGMGAESYADEDLADALAFLVIRSFVAARVGLSPIVYGDDSVGCLSYVGPKVMRYAERFREFIAGECP